MQVIAKQMTTNCLLGVVLFFGITSASIAEPIQIIYEGRGAGSIDGQAFAETDLIVTALADTSSRQTAPGLPEVFILENDSVQISIDGVGDFSFLTGTQTFVNPGFSGPESAVAGIIGATGEGDLFYSSKSPLFASWDMLSSIGPVTGTGNLPAWVLADVNTSGGVLVLDGNATVLSNFTATIIPEPGTMGLAAVAILISCRRRRRLLIA